jgi:hypothetical protein
VSRSGGGATGVGARVYMLFFLFVGRSQDVIR